MQRLVTCKYLKNKSAKNNLKSTFQVLESRICLKLYHSREPTPYRNI